MWLEHMTLRVWTECSSQLSYAAILFCRPHPEWDTGENGCGGGTWTPDLRVMSPTSYRLLYPATLRKDYNSTGRALSQGATQNFLPCCNTRWTAENNNTSAKAIVADSRTWWLANYILLRYNITNCLHSAEHINCLSIIYFNVMRKGKKLNG